MQKKFHVVVSKNKSFREKAKAQVHLRGDVKVQYALLRDYVCELKMCNPDTTVKIDVYGEEDPETPTRMFRRIYVCLVALKRGFREDTTVKIDVYGEEDPETPTRMFRRIYVCLVALKRGFREGGRELLGLDGAFMSGYYPGQMLTLLGVGVDANNGIYPIAYGIVESKNQYSWTWFLKCLRDDFDLYSNLNFTFNTDRKKGLLPSLAKLFPSAEQRYCVRHINGNMNKLKKDHNTRKCYGGRAHCDLFINNVCEVFNRQLLDDRDGPIITALEFIKAASTGCTVEWNGSELYQAYLKIRFMNIYSHKVNLVNGRDMWSKYDCPTTLLPPKVHPQIERPPKKRKKSKGEIVMVKGNKLTWQVPKKTTRTKRTSSVTVTSIAAEVKTQASQAGTQAFTGSTFKRTKKNASRITPEKVNFMKWEISSIPCKHDIVAIHDMTDNGYDVGIPKDWVQDSYKLQTWMNVYSHKVNPDNGRDMWSKYDCPTTLLPPKVHP
nr:hypothetical protein [Tanacetum cinerariifolium]